MLRYCLILLHDARDLNNEEPFEVFAYRLPQTYLFVITA